MNKTNQSVKWNSSYLNMISKELRVSARKEARGSGFEPLFDKTFVVGINPDGHPFVSINYTINGSIQCSNCAI